MATPHPPPGSLPRRFPAPSPQQASPLPALGLSCPPRAGPLCPARGVVTARLKDAPGVLWCAETLTTLSLWRTTTRCQAAAAFPTKIAPPTSGSSQCTATALALVLTCEAPGTNLPGRDVASGPARRARPWCGRQSLASVPPPGPDPVARRRATARHGRRMEHAAPVRMAAAGEEDHGADLLVTSPAPARAVVQCVCGAQLVWRRTALRAAVSPPVLAEGARRRHPLWVCGGPGRAAAHRHESADDHAAAVSRG